MRTVTKWNPERDFFSFFVKTKKVCRCFASSEQEHFIHGMYITALIRPSDVKNRHEKYKQGRPTPVLTPSAHFLIPTTFSSAFLRRCTTDVSIRSSPKAQIYLKCISYIYMYMRFCHLSHVSRLRLACAFFKFHQNFHVLTHIYM